MARRRSQHPSRLGDALKSVLQRIDPDKCLKAYRVWVFWAEEVGEAIATRAQPAELRGGLLSVRVNSPAWMQELHFMKDTIRERLNSRLGEELIRDIRFVAGPVVGRPNIGPVPAPSDTAATSKLPPINDPELAAIFTRIADTHARRRRGAGG